MTLEELKMIFEPMAPGSFAERRYQICNACEHFRDRSKTCTQCNCLMPVKVKIASVYCPLKKWTDEPL